MSELKPPAMPQRYIHEMRRLMQLAVDRAALEVDRDGWWQVELNRRVRELLTEVFVEGWHVGAADGLAHNTQPIRFEMPRDVAERLIAELGRCDPVNGRHVTPHVGCIIIR